MKDSTVLIIGGLGVAALVMSRRSAAAPQAATPAGTSIITLPGATPGGPSIITLPGQDQGGIFGQLLGLFQGLGGNGDGAGDQGILDQVLDAITGLGGNGDGAGGQDQGGILDQIKDLLGGGGGGGGDEDQGGDGDGDSFFDRVFTIDIPGAPGVRFNVGNPIPDFDVRWSDPLRGFGWVFRGILRDAFPGETRRDLFSNLEYENWQQTIEGRTAMNKVAGQWSRITAATGLTEISNMDDLRRAQAALAGDVAISQKPVDSVPPDTYGLSPGDRLWRGH